MAIGNAGGLHLPSHKRKSGLSSIRAITEQERRTRAPSGKVEEHEAAASWHFFPPFVHTGCSQGVRPARKYGPLPDACSNKGNNDKGASGEMSSRGQDPLFLEIRPIRPVGFAKIELDHSPCSIPPTVACRHSHASIEERRGQARPPPPLFVSNQPRAIETQPRNAPCLVSSERRESAIVFAAALRPRRT